MYRRRFASLALGALAAGCRHERSTVTPPGVREDVRDAPALPPAGSEPRAADTPARYGMLAGFCDGVSAVSSVELDERRGRLAAALKEQSADALVIEPGANMQYVGGVRWRRSERPFLAVLRRDGSVGWVCPAFERRSALEQLAEGGEVSVWHEHEDPFALAVALAGGPKARILVDPDARAFVFSGISNGAKRAALDGTALHDARLKKTPLELQRLRRANEATKAAIAAAAKNLAPGMTQSAFAAELVGAQQAAGLRDTWCLALFGPAASFPHGTREDRELGAADVVLVDTGGALHGYCSDVSRTWMQGLPSAEVRRAWTAVEQAQAAAFKKIAPGMACSSADAAARAVIEGAGFGRGYEHFTHRLGHGIGLEGHERPYLRPENDRVLQAGMTMSNEPGIYVPGAFGVRIEDIVVVTETGAEVLGPRVGPLEDPLAGHMPR